MKQIDPTKPVMVTGANGYVASWLVKKLLDEGLTVHAAVRNPENEAKVGHLKKLAATSKGQLKFFKADLLTPDAYKAAMEGCELVFHTASPFTSKIKDPQKDLIDPAVKGTENVLKTASETPSVKRVVVTSSCAAIYSDAVDCSRAPGGVLTEAVWNTTSTIDHVPYSYSKTLAEKRAWEMAKNQDQWDLVTINPSLVLGPALNVSDITSESYTILKQLGDGTMKMGAPKLGLGLVDVRDLAEAHFLAGFTPSASGRYITSGHNTDLLELALALQPKYGKLLPLPKKALPKWLVMIVGPMTNKFLTRRSIRDNVNHYWRADNSKIKRELGVSFRPLQQTMEESFQLLIDAKVLKPKG